MISFICSNKLIDISFADLDGVPVFISSVNKSSFDKYCAVFFINRSLGLSSIGKSFILFS
ncbi:MAG: hypothetical protein R3Y21_02555 [Mycoplasmatota bacterium]